MSLQIHLIQGSQPATKLILDQQKLFFRVGRSSDCEVVLLQPGLPEVACFFECDHEQNIVILHSLCQEQIVLDGVMLRQNEQASWQIGQELRIGSNCQILLEGTLPNTKTPSSTTHRTKPEPGPETSSTRQVDPIRRTAPKPQHRQKPKVEESDATKERLDLNEDAVAEIAKKRSQTTQIVIIALCVIGIIIMILFGSNGNVSPTPPPVPSIGELLEMIDKVKEEKKEQRDTRTVDTLQSFHDRLREEYNLPKSERRPVYVIEEIKRDVHNHWVKTPDNETKLKELYEQILAYIDHRLQKP